MAERSFLSLWSYPGLYKGPGDELCDLLVVFENHVIIFSDKEIDFKESGNLEVDWARWYKRAIRKSADQVFGAERWLKQHPDRVFWDAKAASPFPFTIPVGPKVRFHRIVVAHDPTGRRRRLIGGSGSLQLMPSIADGDHLRPFEQGGAPFVVGQVAPSKGFVHVFDDSCLHLVMGELDTITDFIWYLEKKEQFILSGRLGYAAGEEELLAYYLKKTNEHGIHDFVIPKDVDLIGLDEGHFRDRLQRQEYVAKSKADEVSYAWDDIASRFCDHALGGSLYAGSSEDIREQERLLRFMAREPRVRRRMLSRALVSKVRDTPGDRMSSRVILPTSPGDPHYIFVVVPRSFANSDDEYRKGRAHVLKIYMGIAKKRFPDAEYIVGLATESKASRDRSEDLALLSSADWTEEDEKKAAEDQAELGLLTNLKMEMGTENEYPGVAGASWVPKKVARNAPCPCKSGRKFKKCCGKPR